MRRNAPRKYSVKEKILIVMERLRGKEIIAGCAGERVSRRACITSGARSCWKQAKSAERVDGQALGDQWRGR